MYLDRRSFLKSTLLTSFSLALPSSILKLWAGQTENLRLGLITDFHRDAIHDSDLRLQTFLEEMNRVEVHAKIQLGDFAIPKPANTSFIASFNQGNIPAYHVLGNHDMDEGYSKEQAVQAFGMPSAYYAQVIQGIRILVLDGNELGSQTTKGGYASYIGKVQQDWLNQQLADSNEPVMIISHQPIAGIYTIDNYWVGEKHRHLSLDAKTHAAYPSLAFTCPYAAVLFGVLTLDWKAKKLTLKGRKSSWIGPSPLELGYSILSPAEQEMYLNPQISNREL